MKEIAGAIAGFAVGALIIGPGATWLCHRAYDSLEPFGRVGESRAGRPNK